MSDTRYSTDFAALRARLRRFFSDPASVSEAARLQAASLAAFVRATGATWASFPESADAPEVFALFLPGRTGLLMPRFSSTQPLSEAVTPAMSAAVAACDRLGLHYSQVLIEPGGGRSGEILGSSGFRRITTLLYLEAETPPVAAAMPAVGRWRIAREYPEAALHDLLEATYVGTADCPELNGVRPIEDVIDSHRASGEHVPELWQVLEVDSRPAGCVLLARIPRSDALELVYMGVRHDARGRDFGARLLERAFALMSRQRANRITLAVDVRNAAARRLYQRFGFQEVARRDVFLRVRATPSPPK